MPKVKHVVEISKPRAVVFDMLRDANRIKEWAPVVSNSSCSEDSLQEGSCFSINADLKPVGGPKFDFENVVAKLIGDKEIVWKQTKGTMKKLEWHFLLEPIDGAKSTQLSLAIDYEMPYSFFGAIMDKIKMNRVIDSACKINLEGLKRKAENSAA